MSVVVSFQHVIRRESLIGEIDGCASDLFSGSWLCGSCGAEVCGACMDDLSADENAVRALPAVFTQTNRRHSRQSGENV